MILSGSPLKNLHHKKVFVSGGAGVIGLEMIPILKKAGAIILVGDLKPRPESFSRDILYRQGDLNSLTKTELEGFKPEIFIHLAATFERSIEGPGFWDENFKHNVLLSHHLASLVKNIPSFKRIIFASSYLIYDQDLYQFGEAQEKAFRLAENDPVQPRNLTGMAKMSHEMELQFLSNLEGVPFSILCARIYRGYGKRSRDIISRWVRSLIAGDPIRLYRPEGLFDYIFARDSAEGLVRLAARQDITGLINLGTGKPRRVMDIINILKSHFPQMHVTIGQTEIAYEASSANTDRLKSKLGWVPSLSLEHGIAEIIAYEKTRLAPQNQKQKNIGSVLLSSASGKIPMAKAVRDGALRLSPGAKLIAGDSNPDVISRFFADEFWHMPLLNDVDTKNLITVLKEKNITHIIPSRDGELIFWSNLKETLKNQGIEVIVSATQSVLLCLDKFKFSQFGNQYDLPFIPSALSLESLNKQSIGTCYKQTPPAHYVVKERFGAGSKSIGLDLDEADALSHSRKLSSALFQPFIAGIEISIDAWCRPDNGKVHGLVLRRRDHVISGESQVTTSFHDTDLEKKSIYILEKMKLSGPVVMQALIDRSGDMHVIEINPRFGGASTLGIAAGLDSFYWSLAVSMGVSLDDIPFKPSSVSVKQIRMPVDTLLYDYHF